MKISSKGRYGLAAMIYIADKSRNGEYITIIRIAEDLKISKIYLEQVFSLLKRANLVVSIKGAQGGYRLSKTPSEISAREILEAIEISLFEKADKTVPKTAPGIENAMETLLWNNLDNEVAISLAIVSLQNLLEESEKYIDNNEIMYYI